MLGGDPVNDFDSLGLADSITTRIIALAARKKRVINVILIIKPRYPYPDGR